VPGVAQIATLGLSNSGTKDERCCCDRFQPTAEALTALWLAPTSQFGQQLLFLGLNYNFGQERHIDAIVAVFPNAQFEALLNFDD
jgi:hypothetical protein